MATIAHVADKIAGVGDQTRLIRWTPLTTTNPDGDFIEIPDHTDVTLHFFGTVGAGGNVTWEGTNELTGAANVLTLHDSRGADALNLINITVANASRQVLNPLHRMRPRVTAGDGTTSYTVIAVIRRSTSIR